MRPFLSSQVRIYVASFALYDRRNQPLGPLQEIAGPGYLSGQVPVTEAPDPWGSKKDLLMTKDSDSLWAPLRFSAFRWLWVGALAMNLAIWMQNVGAAWLMVSLSASPLMVALVQTAISLPSF